MGVVCLKGLHIVYFIFGVLGVIFIAVLPPLLLLLPKVRYLPRLKALLDEGMHIYRSEKHWWLSVNLGRRVILCFLSLSPDTVAREVAMTVYLILLLVLHITNK